MAASEGREEPRLAARHRVRNLRDDGPYVAVDTKYNGETLMVAIPLLLVAIEPCRSSYDGIGPQCLSLADTDVAGRPGNRVMIVQANEDGTTAFSPRTANSYKEIAPNVKRFFAQRCHKQRSISLKKTVVGNETAKEPLTTVSEVRRILREDNYLAVSLEAVRSTLMKFCDHMDR